MKRFLTDALGVLCGIGIAFLFLAVILASLLSVFRSCSLYEDTVITAQTREDGAYTVKLLQTSEAFLFSGVTGAVALYGEDGSRLDYVTFHLGHDTVRVRKEDLKNVVWGDGGVTLTVADYDDPEDQVFWLPYPEK